MKPLDLNRTDLIMRDNTNFFFMEIGESHKFYINKWPRIFTYKVGKRSINYVILKTLTGFELAFPMKIWMRLGREVMDFKQHYFQIEKHQIGRDGVESKNLPNSSYEIIALDETKEKQLVDKMRLNILNDTCKT